MDSFDLTGLSRFTDFVGTPSDAFCNVLAENGKQYALYIFHGVYEGDWGAHFLPITGNFLDTLLLNNIPKGNYLLKWLDPSTGLVKKSENLSWEGGNLTLITPEYSLDVAMQIRKQ